MSKKHYSNLEGFLSLIAILSLVLGAIFVFFGYSTELVLKGIGFLILYYVLAKSLIDW